MKLSALSPRYEAVKEALVWDELYPRLLRLAVMAAKADINFTLDAEEADRLVLSLKLLDRLAREKALGTWRGLGLAVQAYQKRAPEVIASLARLAKDTGRRLMVRLVKGAYWDSEIKRAQVAGYPGYPVFTTKPATDLCYLACARLLIEAASSSLRPVRHPQRPHLGGGAGDGRTCRRRHRTSAPARHGRNALWRGGGSVRPALCPGLCPGGRA